MARQGQIITNLATGEHIHFRQTKAETGGAFLEFELRLEPGGVVGGMPHKHLVAERFTVLDGRLAAWTPMGRRDFGPGDTIVVPSRMTHYVFNPGAEMLATVVVEPANDFETFLETTFALQTARRFKVWRGLPGPLQGTLLSVTYDVYGPLLPIPLQRAAFEPLAELARRRGIPAALTDSRVQAAR
jgi:mannose-6-phosphate isomerase-like protein (cupin superfamily)